MRFIRVKGILNPPPPSSLQSVKLETPQVYSAAVKSPPKLANNVIYDDTNVPKQVKPDSANEVLKLTTKIVGLSPVDNDELARNTLEEDEDHKLIYRRTAEEFINKELGFRLQQINDMKIVKVFKGRKEDSNILYVPFEEQDPATQIFRRSNTIMNNDIRILNYIPPQFYERFNTWLFIARMRIWRIKL